VTGEIDQFRSQAEGWSDQAYADAAVYLSRRADLVVGLGPRLRPGEEVLDLACGDGGLGVELVARDLRYRGVDLTPEMVAAARRRLGADVPVEVGGLDDYTPPVPVAATTVFRAVYYARDRAAFFARVAEYTTRKLVFDLNPRQYRVPDVVRDLRGAGFDEVVLRPFFVPQRVALPRGAQWLLRGLERSGPAARLALRFRFTYVVAASRS
jgi:hypothetical protein